MNIARQSACKINSAFLVEPLDRRVMLAGDPIANLGPRTAPSASDYKEIGVNLGDVPYYAPAWFFADALKMESRGWLVAGTYTSVATSNLDATGDPVIAGNFQAQPFQNSSNPTKAPLGLYTVTWEGDGDVTLGNVGSVSNPSVTYISGSPAEHRRVYRLNYGSLLVNMTNNIAGDGHVNNVHVWMPDPAAPYQQTLEPAPGAPLPIWNPQYVDHLREVAANTGFLRFMDMEGTNGSPQVNWADRRPADEQFASGNANYKKLNVPGDPSLTRFGNIGVPWEYVIDLCNQLNVGAWINVPHAATDDYVRNLADLFSGQAPTSPGLKPGLKLYLEHSNEIWSNGSGFVQGDWAQQQANVLGITKPQFTAKRAVEVFRIFDQEYAKAQAGPDGAIGTGDDTAFSRGDIVRVAAAWTGNTGYTGPYLAAMNSYAQSYAGEPAYKPDILAVTTYFGGSSLIKYAFNQANWLGVDLNNPSDAQVQKIFDYWTNDATLNAQGTGTEGDNGSGGFGTAMTALANQYGLRLMSYEGGPSLYTEGVPVYIKDGKIVDSTTPGATFTFSLANYVNANYPDDDGIAGNTDRFTKLLIALNKNPRIADVYNNVLQLAKAQGLVTHGLYYDIGTPTKFGQWGHKEYLGQPSSYANGDAVKWQFIKDFAQRESQIREIGDVLGTAPVIPSNRSLGSVFVGSPIDKTLTTTPGDGFGDQIRYDIVAGKLPPGVTMTKVDDTHFNISGTPAAPGIYRVLVRALDADNDPTYAVYAITAQSIDGISTSYAATQDTFATFGPTRTNTSVANGVSTYLYAGSRDPRYSYVKFDLSSGSIGRTDRITLRLYVRDYEPTTVPPTGGTLFIREVQNTLKDGSTPWSEGTLSDFTAPTPGPQIGAAKTLAANAGGFYEFDVTEYAKVQAGANNGLVSVAIGGSVTGGSNSYIGVRLASREFSGGTFAPRLVVAQSPVTSPVPPQVSIQPILPNPRTGSINSATVVFDQPVTGVDLGDFSLVRDGTVINLSGATINTADNITYAIDNLAPITRTAGAYTLTLTRDGSEIRDIAGTLLGDGDSEGWVAYAGVVGRRIFYNNSAFDSIAAGKSDDDAIATDKVALLPGQTASFVNYTSYSRGINGVMVDIGGLPTSTLSAADFTFKTGNNNTPSTWATLSVTPTINVRKGAGEGGSDRVTLIFPDAAIQKTWLQVTVKNTALTGLLNSDTFYFGNAPGESGGEANAIVNATDEIAARNNPAQLAEPGGDQLQLRLRPRSPGRQHRSNHRP